VYCTNWMAAELQVARGRTRSIHVITVQSGRGGRGGRVVFYWYLMGSTGRAECEYDEWQWQAPSTFCRVLSAEEGGGQGWVDA
jgi:hypothetical protein